MNPALLLALLSGGKGLASAFTAFTKPQQLLNRIPWVGDVYRDDRAVPLDWTVESRGGKDQNREYLVEVYRSGVGRTNRGRLLLPEDVKHFRGLERGTSEWAIRQRQVERATPRTRGWEARITPGPPRVIADEPGRPGQPIGPDELWALMRFAQAQKAGLIGAVPTPQGRDLAAEWRKQSVTLGPELDARRRPLPFGWRSPW